ncbi:hypothetical protein [Streptomyces sp. NPDC056690]
MTGPRALAPARMYQGALRMMSVFAAPAFTTAAARPGTAVVRWAA